MSNPSELQPWRILEQEELWRCRIFSVDRRLSRSQLSERKDDFFVMRHPNWVNVIALTPKRDVVLVEQYRHGVDRITLEIPGGMIDPVDSGPIEAGERELREETGFSGKNPDLIGSVLPNPAIQTNVCHTILVENSSKVAEPSLDPNEEMRTLLVPLEEIGDLIRAGRIGHALVIAAFFHLIGTTRGREVGALFTSERG